jgi:hypothetical protein
MPWAKRFKNLACCIFCHEEYLTQRYRFGYEWHRCAGVDAEKKRLKNAANREYHRQAQAARGKAVTPRNPGHRRDLKPSEERRRLESTGVYIKPEYKLLPCGHYHYNRFNCPQCADRKDSTYNLDFVVEEGGSYRKGSRARA